MKKTLKNSTVSKAKENVSDLQVIGDGDMFQLLCKAYSEKEGWMKSTKSCEIHGVGCIVQVTTQQGENIAEAVCFVPGVKIKKGYDGCKYLCSIKIDKRAKKVLEELKASDKNKNKD